MGTMRGCSDGYHEGVQVGVVSGQVVRDVLDLAPAEAPMLPVLPKEGHIGPIYQGVHWPMFLQPCLLQQQQHSSMCKMNKKAKK